MSVRPPAAVALTLMVLLAMPWSRGEAHKPITSPFTFNDDVFPIVEARCGGCHAPGGVAPMSLLTHADAVPWGESIRAELMAGHMPPWAVEGPDERFRNVRSLTARELNVLLTWASGGTPAGDPEKAPRAVSRTEAAWPLGPPDAIVGLPEITLTADEQERRVEFSVPAGLDRPAFLRAVDLRPGTPAVVRAASVWASPGDSGGHEQLLALWLPGDHPVALDTGTAFALAANATLTVRVRYRKGWESERLAMRDRSEIGLYFAADPAEVARGLTLTSSGLTLPEPVRALAIAPDAALSDVDVTVAAVRPNGSRETLIAFRPRGGWARRYWFREPVLLPRGTRLTVDAALVDDRLLPPAAIRTAPRNPAAVRLLLDVVPAGR